MTESVAKRLIEELSFQNSELIKQNTALQFSKHKVEKESENLNLLYDLTSLGYLVLDINEKIIQFNYNVEKLFGQSISELINSNFSSHIVKEYLSDFNGFLKKAKETKINQTCKIKLISNKKHHYFVYLYGLYIEKEQHYIISLKNIAVKEHFKAIIKENNYLFEETQKLAKIYST